MVLLRAREAVMRHFRPPLRHYDLTEQQWRVLRALASHHGPIEVTLLATATYILPPSLSRILKDLAARQLIERNRSERDGRASLVALSSAGSEMIATIGPVSERIYAEITNRFGPEKMAELMGLLRELEAVLTEGAPISHAMGYDTNAAAEDD